LTYRFSSPLYPHRVPRGSTAQELARVEHLLARFPRLEDSEIQELRHWFRRRATAGDVARLACNEALYPRYRSFRRRYVDPFRWWEKAIVGLLAAFPVAVVAAALAGEA
jgi:hypothetical protein